MDGSSAGYQQWLGRGIWNSAQGCIWCPLDHFKRSHFSTLRLSMPLPPVIAVITVRTTSGEVLPMQKSPSSLLRKSYVVLKKKVLFDKSLCQWVETSKFLLQGVKRLTLARTRWISAGVLSPHFCLRGAFDFKFYTDFPFLALSKTYCNTKR